MEIPTYSYDVLLLQVLSVVASCLHGVQAVAAIILFVVDPGVHPRHALSRAEGAYLPLGQSEQVCCKSDAYWPALDGKRGGEGGGMEGDWRVGDRGKWDGAMSRHC